MELSKNLRIDYFRNQLIAWRICGAVDLSKGNYWSWAMFLVIFVYLPTPMLMKVLFSYEDPLDNNFNFSLTITSLSNFLKFSIYTAKLTKILEIQKLIAQLDARVSGKEQELKHRYIFQHTQRMSKMFLVTYTIVFINAAVPFVFESERSLPLPMWIPFDWKNSIVAYIAALAFQEIGIFFQILQNYPGTPFPPLALFLVSEQCQLLILRISAIGYDSKSLKETEEELVNCIKDQNTLYRLLDEVHSLISYPMMVQFLVIGVNIAITLFILIFYVQTLGDRIYYVCFLMALTVQTYPLCYYGTMVESSFADLHYAIFCSNWVDQSSTYRGYMLILAERTKRRQLLLAGNLVPIHLSTFAACWKGAYSFFTLMADRDSQAS
ncbi:LOW QUALITY PROTEIN: odorant receptor 23a-like [Drosophila eugracilis]|uniref:LOW QUALITY PROTEIN: odorant receptor 23a-like n=1 Tax=Drosophila eugracilis TaxID=29029 RepID=UPI001BD959A6|nr:LOW QUALITY PROTEIN: odorant receptor 23a-like [Drosophila eugracilis]